MEENNYFSIIEHCLRELILNFQSNPYYYFYEEDIRVDLATRLINKTKTKEFIHFENKIITTPVKCEYPGILANKLRHDIVLVKQNSLNNIYQLDLPIIIELKLGSKSYDRCAVFKEDIKKLLNYNTNTSLCIALYFYQDLADNKLFSSWFSDIINEFIELETNNITLDNRLVNSFIIPPSKNILKSISYINF